MNDVCIKMNDEDRPRFNYNMLLFDSIVNLNFMYGSNLKFQCIGITITNQSI